MGLRVLWGSSSHPGGLQHNCHNNTILVSTYHMALGECSMAALSGHPCARHWARKARSSRCPLSPQGFAQGHLRVNWDATCIGQIQLYAASPPGLPGCRGCAGPGQASHPRKTGPGLAYCLLLHNAHTKNDFYILRVIKRNQRLCDRDTCAKQDLHIYLSGL